MLSLSGQAGVVSRSTATGQVVLLGSADAGDSGVSASGSLSLSGAAGSVVVVAADGSIEITGEVILTKAPTLKRPTATLRKNTAMAVVRTGPRGTMRPNRSVARIRKPDVVAVGRDSAEARIRT